LNSFTHCKQVSKELCSLLGISAFTVLEDGEYPACSIRIGESHLLLIRHFGYSFTISLPTEKSFSFRNSAEMSDALPKITLQIADYRARHREIFTIADAAVLLRPLVANSADSWTLNFPGTPIPSEAWLRSSRYDIGIFQEATYVRVVVWVGSAMHSFDAVSAQTVNGRRPWLEQQLQAQLVAGKLAAEEAAREAAMPPPTTAAAVAALHKGKRLQLGAARWYEVYFIAGGKLRREIHDEGYTVEEDCTEENLAQAIKNHAAQAHQQLQ
jgi:hypothetical protein